MPVIRPLSKVLVSGANGFIATWVIRNLLEHGYSVRGTVRSSRKGEHLKKYFAGYGDKLEIVIVEDITKEGAFDEAVKGVDAIAHTASPLSDRYNHSDDVIGPAIRGTIGILQSAKFSESIKRVVFTSSGATIVRDSDTPVVLTEEDWNVQCLDEFEKLGEGASDRTKYRASKTLAEQAAWKFMQAHKHEIGWDLSVLNPTVVFGPVIHEVTDPSSLSLTPGRFYNYVADREKSEEAGNEFLGRTGSSEWVDVRDLADAHRLSLETEEAGNGRFIINAGSFNWQDFIDVANALDPLPKLSKPLPKGNPGAGSQHPATAHMFTLDNSKSKRVLGLKYCSMEETTRDIFADYEARGW